MKADNKKQEEENNNKMHPYVDTVIKFVSAVFNFWYNFSLAIVTRILELILLSWLTVYYIGEAVVLTFTPGFMQRQKSLRGKIVLVTGGAGGVGQELALRLARHKARVVVWDNNEKALAQVQDRIESEGYKVHTYAVDVTDRALVYKTAALVKSEIGPVDILVNNAGVVCGQKLLELPDDQIEKTFRVNILSHYWTTKAVLPDMMRCGRGHLVTVASLTGMLGTYKCTDYSATKHATIGFHESLMVELKTHGFHRINTTLIAPYFINTGMFDGCKPRTFAMLEPKDVAKRIITAIKYEEEFVTMPGIFRYVLPLKYFIPAKLAWALNYRVIQGPQSMMGMGNTEEVEAA